MTVTAVRKDPHRLTMTIDVETRCFFSSVLPETSRPFSQHLGETLCATALGQVGEKPFDVKVSIGPLPSGEQSKGIARVTAQIARAAQTNGIEQP